MFGDQTIIRTRITPPRRRKDLVNRTRLNQLLTEMIEKRLVLVSAPAGYGKTSLLIDFIGQTTLPVCWYSIDRLDIDPWRFIAYFAASIQNRFPAFGQRTAAALSGGQTKFDPELIASVFINDIYENISEHFLMVLDDYHLVNDSLDIRNFFNRLLSDLDENCHVVLASRTLLSLPVLPHLVARSEADGLSYEELEFLPEEIQQLYQINQQPSLSLEMAREIQLETEGWVTGIVLTSQVKDEDLALRARINRISGFSLDKYFSQILDFLPTDLRSFLLWSSLLEEFNVDRCEKIIGPVIARENIPWQQWINEVQRQNLFTVPVGEDGDWLRYHPLFLEFLQKKIRQQQPDIAFAIQHSFAKFCHDNEEWDQAFSIYRRLDSLDDLILLVEQVGLEMILKARISTLSAWLDSLPTEVLNTRPYIIALQGNVALVMGNTNLAISLLNRAIDSLANANEKTKLIRALSMRVAGLRITGRLDDAKKDAEEIISLAGEDPQFLRLKGSALRDIGLCYFHQGDLQNALEELEKALHLMQSINDIKNQAIIQLEIGLVYENLGNYSNAKNNYLIALDSWKSIGNSFWLSNILNNLAVLYQLLGDYAEASQAFEEALGHARSCGYARMEAFILTGMGDIFLEVQVDDQALQAYYMAEVIADRTQEHFLQVYIKIQKALLLAYKEDFNAAYNILDQAYDLVRINGSQMEQHLIDLDFSGIKILEKKPLDALSTLEKVCAFFELGGHRVQYEKAHLYLVLAYISLNQSEQVLEHLLHIFSSLENLNPPATMLASAARFKKMLKGYTPDLMQSEFDHFLNQIDQFVAKLPGFRRELRKNSRAIPFSPPTMFIRSLGRMQVILSNHQVTSSEWQTQAARDMFFMLLAHPEGMTKEEMSLIFWPDATIDEVKFRFKNTIYRLRRALGKDSIILDQNVYRFNNKLDYEYDVELFLRENALANQVQVPVDKLTHYREAIKYYKGNYLSEIDENWVFSPREYLRQIFLNILLQVSMIYFNQSNYDLALDYCLRAINEDNLLEDAYRQAMKIYAAMGNRAAMVHQYQRCVEVLEREVNAPPSDQTHDLYEFLLN
ncbi:MAG: tetratricopeptide repeat protein [Anaerolineaceae bacterium]|jgi:ATP/maltotriose-dependent transcriptional regulator MalT/DNA-binding SARP family transcriptional activator|nr:tetratricopeptide repeat protein [Anaerolineaceae bacterium]